MKVLMFLSLFVFSVAQAKEYQFRQFWKSSDWLHLTDQSTVRYFEKQNLVLPQVTNATLTITRKGKGSKERTLELFKKSVGPSVYKWHSQNFDGLEIHEGVSYSRGEIFRLAFNLETRDFSIATIQLRYMMPTYLEVHQLQVEFLKGKKPSGRRTVLMDLLMPAAQAGITLPGGIFTDTGAIAGAIKEAGNAIRGGTDAINRAATQAGAIAGSVNNGADAVRGAGNSIREAVDFAKSDQSGRLAKYAILTGSLFKLSGELTSMTMHFLGSGFMSALRFLWFEGTGTFTDEEKKQRIENFERNMKALQDVSPQLQELTVKVTMFADAMAMTQGETAEHVLARLNDDIEMHKAKLNAPLDPACPPGLLEKQIEYLQQIKSQIELAGLSQPGQPINVCGALDRLYGDWVQAERVIADARIKAMNDMRVFIGSMIAGTVPQSARQEDRKQNNSFKAQSEKIISSVEPQTRGKDCRGKDSEVPVCQQLTAHQDIIASLEEIEKSKPTEADTGYLAQRTKESVDVFKYWLKNMAAKSCDESVQTCGPETMVWSRRQVTESLDKAANQCPQSLFAEHAKNRNSKMAKTAAALGAASQVPLPTSPKSDVPKRCSATGWFSFLLKIGCPGSVSPQVAASEAVVQN